jgi:UDP-2,4-diacetamido-2,4,6-trideoxy-beta-L-altropyranose hydrolase
MLRREFRAAPPRPGDGVVITLGGADPEGRTAVLLDALTRRGIRGTVVIGPHDTIAAALRARAEALGWISIAEPPDMARVIGSAAVVVAAAGTTVLECLALGVPMVSVPIADNQLPVAAALMDKGLAVVVRDADPPKVAEATVRLLADPRRRAAMADEGQRIVDGRGAQRVAGAMRGALLRLRVATGEDARLLHGWANDAETREASFDSSPIPWDDHVAWLGRALASPDLVLLIGEVDRRPIGVVRLERRHGAAVMSVTVAPESRSLGLASPLIRAGLVTAAELAAERVEALIKEDNLASRRAFAAAGFTDAPREGGDEVPGHAVRMVALVSTTG